MPLYEYKCSKCGHRFDKIESVSSSHVKKCPKCGAKAERQISAPAFQFKGSGWYVTDYARKKSGAAAGDGSGDGAAAKPAEKEKAPASESKSAEPAKTASSSEKPVAKKKK